MSTAEPLEQVIERSAEPAFVLDPADDRFLGANDAACAMLGYTRAQLLATPVSAVHRGELPQLEAVVAEVLRRGHAVTDTLTCRTVSGRSLPVAMSLAALELDGRTLVVGLVHDRSEHRRAAALEVAEEPLRSGSDPDRTLPRMVTKGLIVRLEARAGREAELAAFLRDALPLVREEPQTVAWLALRLSDSSFAIVDAFPDEDGRRAHLDGAVAAALMANAETLLAAPPEIEPVDVLAATLP